MRQNCQMALAMPTNCVPMNEDEMSYVEGGSYNLGVSKRYLSKSCCQSTASWLKNTGRVKNMSNMAIAKEIFTHAYCYYNYAKVKLLFGTAVAVYCYAKAADGIAIMDGGDTGLRKSVYNKVWEICPSNERYS